VKQLLFVIDSLGCAGAEKSLVTLLRLLDYKKYAVDLLLFAHGKELEVLVPDEVNILPPLKYTQFSNLSLNQAVFNAVRANHYNLLLSRINFSMSLRKQNYSNAEKARLFWQHASRVIEKSEKEYDVAISYAQGVPTFYVSEKVNAKRKLAWVNVSYRLDSIESKFQEQHYDQFDKIVAVSESTKDIYLETFPKYKEKIKVVYDISNPELINRMVELGNGFRDSYDGFRIITVARLANQKGYEIALDACKKMKEAGLHFKWYAIGDGPLRHRIEKLIKKNDLTEHFILLGSKSNPYPYVKNADLYVQTSKFEGFGLAIAEARMLNIPVVTTNFDAVYSQMVDGKNGLVVEMNGDAVFAGVSKLYSNFRLRKQIANYQKTEKKGNLEEMQKIYQLIG